MEFKDIKVGSFLKNLENKELHEVVEIGLDWLSNCNYAKIIINHKDYKYEIINNFKKYERV